MGNCSELKAQVSPLVDEMSDLIVGLSRRIYENPELALAEHEAAKLISRNMSAAGFEIESNVAGLETAFRAVHPARSAGPTIAFLAEYDALPLLGHACGHNIIAGIAIGASLAVGRLKDRLPGRLQLIGCPAEETAGGKIIMANKNAFDGVDVAMMVHAGSENGGTFKTLTVVPLEITFSGITSHAAAAPERGVNALSAVIQTFNSVNALREHFAPCASVHGIITKGGERANMVPELAQCQFSIRAPERGYRNELVTRVKNCARAAALVTGCKVKFGQYGLTNEPMKVNAPLDKAFLDNLASLGLAVEREPKQEMASTDAANVSQILPLLHGHIAIAPEGTELHTKEFAEAAASSRAMRAMLDAAKACAMTAIEIYCSADLQKQIRDAFERNE